MSDEQGMGRKDFRSSKREALNVPVSKLPLLDEPNNGDFRSSFHWRVLRIMAEFVDGWQFLGDYKKIVTFFGSARTEPGDRWYEETRSLSNQLARMGYDIVTGGGPGVMQAANQGAHELHEHSSEGMENTAKEMGDSVGLNIKLPFEQRINPYVDKAVAFHYFFVRKVMLSYYAQAYVFLPGGFGTLDEFFEIVTLMQTKKITTNIPIILIGKEFWSPLLTWIEKFLYEKYGNIDHQDMNLYALVDSAEEALEIIKNTPERTDF